MIGSSASVLVEYDRADHWLDAGVDYAERVEMWNHRHYMAAHLAHVQWASGRWELADQTAEHALADGRGGITTRITAEHVLGYLAMGRGDWARATEVLGDALRGGRAHGRAATLSPALWGLTRRPAARRPWRRDRPVRTAGTPPRRGSPMPPTCSRSWSRGARPAGGRRADAAGNGSPRSPARSPPARSRHLPCIDHGRGLLLLDRGDLAAAGWRWTGPRPGWRERRRFWEGTWALLDQARGAIRPGAWPRAPPSPARPRPGRPGHRQHDRDRGRPPAVRRRR